MEIECLVVFVALPAAIGFVISRAKTRKDEREPCEN